MQKATRDMRPNAGLTCRFEGLKVVQGPLAQLRLFVCIEGIGKGLKRSHWSNVEGGIHGV